MIHEGLYSWQRARSIELTGVEQKWVRDDWFNLMIDGRVNQFFGTLNIVGANICFSLAGLIVAWGQLITKANKEDDTSPNIS